MYDYFDLFRTVRVNGIDIIDISTALKVTSNLTKYLSSYYVSESETINDVSYKIYGDDRLYWLIYLVNPGLQFNEPATSEAMLEYNSAKYDVSCLKLNSEIQLFPGESSVELYASDIDTNEQVAITEIDYTRKLVILSRWVDRPSLYYKLSDRIVPITNKALINEYITTGYIEDGYLETVTDIVSDQEFDNIKYGDATRHFVYNGTVYFQNPAFAPIDKVSSFTFSEYENAVNDAKRFISVISPEHKNAAMEVIRRYMEDNGL